MPLSRDEYLKLMASHVSEAFRTDKASSFILSTFSKALFKRKNCHPTSGTARPSCLIISSSGYLISSQAVAINP
jgi:hypothetical protein